MNLSVLVLKCPIKFRILLMLSIFSQIAFAQHTADVTSGGTASASSELALSPAADAFDNNTTTSWIANSPVPETLDYDFGAGSERAIVRYRIHSTGSGNNDPRTWRIYGSENGVSFTLLDTRTGESLAAGFNTYDFSNTTSYQVYRLEVVDTRTGLPPVVAELEFLALSQNNWLGTTDANSNGFAEWTDDGNWSAGIPQPEQDITIGVVGSNLYPETSGDAIVTDLTISATEDTSLLINVGDSIRINGTFSGLNRVQGPGILSLVQTMVQNTTYTFGDIGLIITAFGGIPGVTTITRYGTSPPNGASLVSRYFDIQPTNNSGLNATVVFDYDSDLLNGNTSGSMVFYRSTDNGANYTEEGGSDDGSSVTITGVNAFSIWATGDPTSFPVEWLSFEVKPDNSGVGLSWSTASESENAGYWIQHKSGESKNELFRDVQFIRGRGNTSEVSYYAHHLSNLRPGTHTFRLKQIDFGGGFSFSEVVEVNLEDDPVFDVSFPTPFYPHNDKVTIRFQADRYINASLFDLNGKKYSILHDLAVPLFQDIVINMDEHRFPTGNYILVVSSEKHFSAKRMMIVSE